MNPYKDKICLVTGGGAGIGRALCLELGRRGALVAVSGRSPDNVEETAALVNGAGGRAYAARLDVSVEKDVQALVDAVVSRHGRLDYIFNNAGISIAGEVRDLSMDQWKQVIDVNLMGVLHGALAAYRVMVRQGFGHIVNLGSLASLLPFPVKAPYATTKHAILGFSTTLRAEAAGLGVKVSVVCPGVIGTGIWMKTPIMRATNEEMLKIVKVPMYSVDKAARRILEGVAKNRGIITFPFHARMAWRAYRMHPALMAPVVAKLIKDFRKIRKP